MKNTIKIILILVASMFLAISCGEEIKNSDSNNNNENENNEINNKDNTNNTENKYKVTTVPEAVKKCKNLSYINAPASYKGYNRIVKPESIRQLKELLTKDKVYKRFEMNEEKFNEIMRTVAMWSGPRHCSIAFSVELDDMDALLIFHIKEDDNFVLSYLHGNNVYFKLEEGTFDVEKIRAVCIEGLKAPKN